MAERARNTPGVRTMHTVEPVHNELGRMHLVYGEFLVIEIFPDPAFS